MSADVQPLTSVLFNWVTDRLITADIIRAHDVCEFARSAIKYLGMGVDLVVNQVAHTRMRNYLVAQMAINNATRTGVITNMTVENVLTSARIGCSHVVKVCLQSSCNLITIGNR